MMTVRTTHIQPLIGPHTQHTTTVRTTHIQPLIGPHTHTHIQRTHIQRLIGSHTQHTTTSAKNDFVLHKIILRMNLSPAISNNRWNYLAATSEEDSIG